MRNFMEKKKNIKKENRRRIKKDLKKRPLRGAPSDRRAFFLFAMLKMFFSGIFSLTGAIKNIFKKALEKYKVLCEKIKPRFLPAFLRRHYPLFLAIVFLAPAFILLFLFVSSRITH